MRKVLASILCALFISSAEGAGWFRGDGVKVTTVKADSPDEIKFTGGGQPASLRTFVSNEVEIGVIKLAVTNNQPQAYIGSWNLNSLNESYAELRVATGKYATFYNGSNTLMLQLNPSGSGYFRAPPKGGTYGDIVGGWDTTGMYVTDQQPYVPRTIYILPALDAATNAQARVAVVETNSVTPGDTNGWEVGSHTAFLTAETDPVFATNGVKKADTNAWEVGSHAEMARALYTAGKNYMVEATTYPYATNRVIGFRRGYAGAPLPPPDPTPYIWEDIGSLSMTRETVYDWYYYTDGMQVAHDNTDTYHWTGEALFFDIPYAVFSSRLSASTLDVGTGYFNAIVGEGSGITGITAAQVGAVSNGQNNVALGTNLHLVGDVVVFSETDADNIGLESITYPVTKQTNGVWVGYGALFGSVGKENSAVGYASMYNSIGSYNSAFGGFSLNESSGSENAAMGNYALKSSAGMQNAALGTYALSQAPGSFNSAVGFGAGYQSAGVSNTFIGYKAGFSMVSSFYTNAIAIGAGSVPIGNNSAVLGNSQTAMTELKGNVGIVTNTPAATLHVNGSVRIEGGTTNVGPLVVQSNIIQTSGGWNDLLFPANTIYAAALTDIEFAPSLNAITFKTTCNTNFASDNVWVVGQLPHSIKTNSAFISPHVHFLQTGAAQTNMFFLRYKRYAIGATIPATWTDLGVASNTQTYTSGTIHQLAECSDIAGPFRLSEIFDFKIWGRGGVAVDMKQFDIHYQADSLGSDGETTKSF